MKLCYSGYCFQSDTAHIPLLLQTMARRFEIEDTITRQCRRFSATGTQLVVRFLPPYDDTDTVKNFLDSMNDLFLKELHNLSESDIV